jgi:hypothetical protein
MPVLNSTSSGWDCFRSAYWHAVCSRTARHVRVEGRCHCCRPPKRAAAWQKVFLHRLLQPSRRSGIKGAAVSKGTEASPAAGCLGGVDLSRLGVCGQRQGVALANLLRGGLAHLRLVHAPGQEQETLSTSSAGKSIPLATISPMTQPVVSWTTPVIIFAPSRTMSMHTLGTSANNTPVTWPCGNLLGHRHY